MATIIKKGEIVDIEIVEDAVEEPVVEKAADPPTNEMVLARIDQLSSIVSELSETVKTLKQAPKPPMKDKEKEKEKEKKAEKVEDAVEEKAEEIVEKVEQKIDVVALIQDAVKKEVAEKIGDQPIIKRSTAPAEALTFDTPMDIPWNVMANADVESILKMGGYTTKRRPR